MKTSYIVFEIILFNILQGVKMDQIEPSVITNDDLVEKAIPGDIITKQKFGIYYDRVVYIGM